MLRRRMNEEIRRIWNECIYFISSEWLTNVSSCNMCMTLKNHFTTAFCTFLAITFACDNITAYFFLFRTHVWLHFFYHRSMMLNVVFKQASVHRQMHVKWIRRNDIIHQWAHKLYLLFLKQMLSITATDFLHVQLSLKSYAINFTVEHCNRCKLFLN